MTHRKTINVYFFFHKKVKRMEWSSQKVATQAEKSRNALRPKTKIEFETK